MSTNEMGSPRPDHAGQPGGISARSWRGPAETVTGVRVPGGDFHPEPPGPQRAFRSAAYKEEGRQSVPPLVVFR